MPQISHPDDFEAFEDQELMLLFPEQYGLVDPDFDEITSYG